MPDDDYTVDVWVERERDAIVDARTPEEAEQRGAEQVEDEYWPDAILDARALSSANDDPQEMTQYTVDVWTEECITESVRADTPDEAEAEAREIVEAEYWPERIIDVQCLSTV